MAQALAPLKAQIAPLKAQIAPLKAQIAQIYNLNTRLANQSIPFGQASWRSRRRQRRHPRPGLPRQKADVSGLTRDRCDELLGFYELELPANSTLVEKRSVLRKFIHVR
mmetsp:Transcript_11514/g.37841  ORF Transcript_11514/g.37841 Transcript_11514/m.37841 type:complete len:109 (-) Transcript_11514:199-525(-)